MSRQAQAILGAALLLAAAALAGCGKPAGRHSRTVPTAAPATSSSSPASSPARAAAPAGERAALDAVGVAQAFTAAVCPYSWRDATPYGQRLDAALARWGTPAFAAAHAWSPARTAAAAAGLAGHQAEQVCGQVTGGLDPESESAAGVATVRLSVTVTAQALGSAASSAQQVFDLQLARQDNGGWLISSGRW